MMASGRRSVTTSSSRKSGRRRLPKPARVLPFPTERRDDDEAQRVYDLERETELLEELYADRYTRVMLAIHTAVENALGDVVDDFRLPDPHLPSYLSANMKGRPIMVTQATRDAIGKLLAEGAAQGLSARELAYGSTRTGFPGIHGLYRETYRNRSELIARTELQHALITSSLDRYRASGVVRRVRIVDGDYDAACAARNGNVVPVEQTPQLLHPACTLSTIPIVEIPGA